MARGIEFDEANKVLTAPPGQERDVHSLHVHEDLRLRTVTSCWQLSDEELAEILTTRRIWLTIQGTTMPPAWVRGNYPFD